ncbi:putative MFS-type transporter YttB [Alicyclobacillus contaminans]|nr:putative MFS-type transporter YttB [Alicyclobacillus contaminans]
MGGLSLLWPVNAIYIHSVLHQPLTVASLVLMVYSGAGFIGSYVGGRLYDALGATPVLVAGLVLSAILILIPVATADWYTYIAVMALFGATCAIPFPVLNAMAGHAWPEGGRRAFNFLYVANNLGVAAGTAVGGVLAQWSFDTVFIGICAAYLLFVLLVVGVLRKPFARISEVRRQHAAAADDQVSMAVQPRVPWVPVVVMFIGYVSAWMVYVQWQSTISVYMKAIGYPLTMYSVLWTLNGLLIFALQPLISRIVARWSSLSAHMIAGTLLYAVAFGLLIRGNQYPMFVAAMVVTTVGELFVWPAVPAAIAVLAPDNRLGTLQGLVASCATLGRMIGPVIGGVLYDHTAMANVLVVMCCATVLPAACFIGFGWLNRRGLSASGVPHSS